MMVRRMLIEIGREARRPVAAIFLAAFVLFAGLSALAFEAILSIETYFQLVYLWTPLLFAPWAAWVASRDRERGLAPVLATTPLTHLEQTIARIAFMGGFVFITLLLTGPITLLALPSSSAAFAERALQFFLWSFYVGWSSAIAGLIIGTLFPRSLPVVMALGSLSVLGQYFMGVITPFLVTRQIGTTPVPFAILHIVPLLWPMEAMHLVEGYELEGNVLAGALAAFVFQILILALVVALQDRSGWSRPRTATARRAVALVAVAAALSAGLLIALTPDAEAEQESFGAFFSSRPVQYGALAVNVSFLNQAGEDVTGWDFGATYVDILHGEHPFLVIAVRGPPNTTLAVARPSLTSPWGSAKILDEGPFSIVLNSTGVGQTRMAIAADIVQIENPFFPIKVNTTIDGRPVQIFRIFRFAPVDDGSGTGLYVFETPAHPTGTSLAALLPGALAVPLSVASHRRTNTWNP